MKVGEGRRRWWSSRLECFAIDFHLHVGRRGKNFFFKGINSFQLVKCGSIGRIANDLWDV